MELYNDVKAYSSRIKALVNASAKAGEILHELGYNALMHVENTGDVRPLQSIYDACKPSMASALRVWSISFGKVRFEKGTFAVARKATTDREAIASIAPLDYVKPKAASKVHTFDFKKALKALRDKAEKEGFTVENKAFAALQRAFAAA